MGPVEQQVAELLRRAHFEHVYLTAQEYEAIRADSSRFAVADGHVFPEAERVVAQPDGYEIVEKYNELRGILERTDPRRDRVEQ
jgi:hypothetical protein